MCGVMDFAHSSCVIRYLDLVIDERPSNRASTKSIEPQ